jgi:hypothetical protein
VGDGTAEVLALRLPGSVEEVLWMDPGWWMDFCWHETFASFRHVSLYT